MNGAELQRLFDQAMAYHQRGDLPAAENLYLRLRALAPNNSAVLQMLGVLRGQQGRSGEALEAFTAGLRLNSRDAGLWMNSGNVLLAMARLNEALAAFDKADALAPNQPNILFNRSSVLLAMGKPAEALALLDKVLRLAPGMPEAWNGRGTALSQMGRLEEALASFDRALSFRRDADLLNRRGIILSQLGRSAEGLQSFDQAIALAPNFADAWCNRANALRHAGRLDEALASCDRALALNPNFAVAWDHKGIVLWEMRRMDQALECYDRALALNPNDAEVLSHRSVLLRDLRRLDEALQSVDRALALASDHAEAHYNRANILHNLKRFEEAQAAYGRARALDPNHRFALSGVADMALNLCDWDAIAALAPQLQATRDSISPLILLGYGSEPAFQRVATANFLISLVPHLPPPLATTPYAHEKIRVGYLSADFNRHPVAHQIAELIEHHDRGRFAVSGISFGRDDGSAIRARLEKAFDEFHDVAALDSSAIAALIRRQEIDILVDLGGHTLGSRVDILAHHPAPLQVSYLGYPATMAAPFIDYLIADSVVLPPGQDEYYEEKIVRLPHSYWTGARMRDVGPTPSRAEAGLPAEGFVFCAFNNHWKTTQAMFEAWMRILAGVPGSILWLKQARDSVQQRLQAAAALRGIDPARLVFAPALDDDRAHLARQRLADLFLDTIPYNAHATASDALSMGLPLVTCMGTSFHSRVAASMLHALDLDELVTHSMDEYEALVLSLARDPGRLRAVRAKLAAKLDSAPLFDSARTARAIEAAFLHMQDIVRRGEKAQSFTVADPV